MTTKKEDQIILDCYCELFKKSTPSADFNELMENATINDRGEKEIPFMDYEIDDELLIEIVDKYAKQFKTKWKKKAFSTTIFLGCSPKSIPKKKKTS